MGGGLSALHDITSLDGPTRSSLQNAIRTLIYQAHSERSLDSSKGRIMLGFCVSNAPETLSGLKTWVTNIELPRGMLHGMDVDSVPIPVEELGPVYVKYSTEGAMKWREMRKSGRGFDALWRPGGLFGECMLMLNWGMGCFGSLGCCLPICSRRRKSGDGRLFDANI
ncbi:hypothetical protein ACHAXR_003187 [Thalassiosira sp. AJA248-18]